MVAATVVVHRLKSGVDSATGSYRQTWAGSTIQENPTYKRAIDDGAAEDGAAADTAYGEPFTWPGYLDGTADTTVEVGAWETLSDESSAPIVDFAAVAHQVFSSGQLRRGANVLYPKVHQHTELETCHVLGQGSFGVVRLGTLAEASHRNGKAKRWVAVKTTLVARKAVPDPNKARQNQLDLVQEAMVMAQLQHPNVAELVGICVCPGRRVALLSQYYAGGSLRLQLVAGIYQAQQFGAAVLIGVQVSAGMDYLGSMGLVHRDLATRNILVDTSRPHRSYKIADFGLARRMKTAKVLSAAGGRPEYYRQQTEAGVATRWVAPEAMLTMRFSSSSDVWSMGVLLWEVISNGVTPYAGMHDLVQLIAKISVGHRLELPPDCPTGLANTIKSCWCSAPGARPSFRELHTRFQALLEGATSGHYVRTHCADTGYDK